MEVTVLHHASAALTPGKNWSGHRIGSEVDPNAYLQVLEKDFLSLTLQTVA